MAYLFLHAMHVVSWTCDGGAGVCWRLQKLLLWDCPTFVLQQVSAVQPSLSLMLTLTALYAVSQGWTRSGCCAVAYLHAVKQNKLLCLNLLIRSVYAQTGSTWGGRHVVWLHDDDDFLKYIFSLFRTACLAVTCFLHLIAIYFLRAEAKSWSREGTVASQQVSMCSPWKCALSSPKIWNLLHCTRLVLS